MNNDVKKYLSKKSIAKKASGVLATAILVGGLVSCNANKDVKGLDEVPTLPKDIAIAPLTPGQYDSECFEHDYEEKVTLKSAPTDDKSHCWEADMITYNQCKNCGKVEGKIVNTPYFDKDGNLIGNPDNKMVLVDEYYEHKIIGQIHEPRSPLAQFSLWFKDKCKNCGKDIKKQIVPADKNTNMGKPQWEWELSK